MEFHRLSAAFYARYGSLEEILIKESRPYYVLLIELEGRTFAIPLRSHITHPYCFIADTAAYIEAAPVTIRQREFKVLKQREFLIKRQFTAYAAAYRKETVRRIQNPALPESSLCRYSALKYFHTELGF